MVVQHVDFKGELGICRRGERTTKSPMAVYTVRGSYNDSSPHGIPNATVPGCYDSGGCAQWLYRHRPITRRPNVHVGESRL
jgi:hypothetical protein